MIEILVTGLLEFSIQIQSFALPECFSACEMACIALTFFRSTFFLCSNYPLAVIVSGVGVYEISTLFQNTSVKTTA